MLIAEQIIEDIFQAYSDLHKNDYGFRPRRAFSFDQFQVAVEWIEGRPNQAWGYGDAPTAADEAYFDYLDRLEREAREDYWRDPEAYYEREQPWGSEDAEPLPYEEFDVVA